MAPRGGPSKDRTWVGQASNVAEFRDLLVVGELFVCPFLEYLREEAIK